jgi:hypothetical protein
MNVNRMTGDYQLDRDHDLDLDLDLCSSVDQT